MVVKMKVFYISCIFSFCLTLSLLSQPGDLPIPDGYEENLKRRGAAERFLPVQADLLVPTREELQRGWQLFKRDRNFEVLPNSRPAPDEAITVLEIVATPGEIESESFSIHALSDVSDLSVFPRVTDDGAGEWLTDAVVVEDVLFHPVQYRLPDQATWPTLSYLRYPIFIRPASAHELAKGTSRLYWVTVDVPDIVEPGVYGANIRIVDGAGSSCELPLAVRVLPFRLTTEGLPRFGAFLSGVPFAKGEWAFMKRYGLDALQWFWGSHEIEIINDNGRLRMGFARYDEFVKGMQSAGMKGPLVLSLGNSWEGHYEIRLAEAFGLKLMRRELEGRVVTLADFADPRWEELWLEGLKTILEHAKEADWPELALLIHDEPTKHIMAYHPYKYHLVKKHFPDVPVYGVFFQPEKDPAPLLKSCDIMVANRDLQRIKGLAKLHDKRFWTYNNVCADESFGKIRLLYGQIPSFYESEVMWFWSWNYWIGNPWDDFDGRGETDTGPSQSDADWVAVYPSVDGVRPIRTLAIEAAREGIDDVRYVKTLENLVSRQDPDRWEKLRREIRRRQADMFNGIDQDKRIYRDSDFFVTTRNDDVERLRSFVIKEILAVLGAE